MLRERLNDALKEAMKAKDSRRVSTLRLILAALKDRDIAARGKGESEEVGEDQILQMLSTMVRQRRESIAQYEQGGRVDLAEQEQEEIAIIEDFLPQQLSEDETRDVAQSLVGELNASGIKDMGRVMGEIKKRYAGQVDMGKASALVKDLLS